MESSITQHWGFEEKHPCKAQALLNSKNVFFVGLLTHDVEMFGNSWMEMDPHQNTCPPVGSSFPSPCNALDVQVLMVRKHTKENNQIRQEQTDHFLSLCREWRRSAPCSSAPPFRAVTTLSARCPTWPVAPTTSAGNVTQETIGRKTIVFTLNMKTPTFVLQKPT